MNGVLLFLLIIEWSFLFTIGHTVTDHEVHPENATGRRREADLAAQEGGQGQEIGLGGQDQGSVVGQGQGRGRDQGHEKEEGQDLETEEGLDHGSVKGQDHETESEC